MKIGPLESKPATAPAAAADRKGASSGAGAGAASEVEPSSKVDLSAAALLSSNSTTKTDPTFDTEKVERIAQAIRDGKFTVNAEAIADKLIVNAEELLGRKLS